MRTEEEWIKVFQFSLFANLLKLKEKANVIGARIWVTAAFLCSSFFCQFEKIVSDAQQFETICLHLFLSYLFSPMGKALEVQQHIFEFYAGDFQISLEVVIFQD